MSKIDYDPYNKEITIVDVTKTDDTEYEEEREKKKEKGKNEGRKNRMV